uniref:PKHD1 like 1, tandem duplicate 1 n=1 Tax=Gadus morhua TaxID=8049 RepID=A0A8C5F806_GADMO
PHIVIVLKCCFFPSPPDSQRIDRVGPRVGSINGAMRFTIEGDGFAQERQFQLNPTNNDFGNRVTLVSATLSFPCDVERDSTHGGQIMCYTRAMPVDQYFLHVTVDGVPIPDNKVCRGVPRHCSFYVRPLYRLPVSPPLTLLSAPPFLLGRIFTDVYGSNTATSTNGINSRFLRAYMGGMPCELLKPDSDELYRLHLDTENSWWGYMSCRITGTYVGHHNLSYILDANYGRSAADQDLFRISAGNKLSMFQTYAEVTGVSPSEGSVLGGTLVSIQGRFFDETDQPAVVLVGGKPCRVQSVSDEIITCITPKQPMETGNVTAYPGGRGWVRQVWNATRPRYLSDILAYNTSKDGYWSEWRDSLPYSSGVEDQTYSSRLRGFFVAPTCGDYTLYLQCDDRCDLYFSNSTRPEDKVKIAFQTRYRSTFFQEASQKSEVMALEKGKAYYMEVLHQDYGGLGGLRLGLFTGQSAFTADQSDDAVNEVQQIVADYDVEDEEQAIRFDSWPSVEAVVQEVQKVNVSSGCLGQPCDSTFFSLAYGGAETGPIAVSASAKEMGDALNELWSLKPERVQVSKEVHGLGACFTVTFVSERGDFEDLVAMSLSEDTSVSVAEVTKGQGSWESFTLSWGGIPSQPIRFNATAEELKSAMERMLMAECPSEVQAMEGSNIIFYRDFEPGQDQVGFTLVAEGVLVSDEEAFCGAWSMKNQMIMFTEGFRKESGRLYGQIPLQLYSRVRLPYGSFTSYVNKNNSKKNSHVPMSLWSYTCVDLLSPLQREAVGTRYQLEMLLLYKNEAGEDFYVDTIHLAKAPTTNNIPRRRPPAFGASRRSFESLRVTRDPRSSMPHYHVIGRPRDCAHGFPLLEVGFLQKSSNSTEDMAEYRAGGANVTVSRSNRATPPLRGTFDVEIYGGRAEGLSVDIGEEDLKHALEGIPGMGQVQVKAEGSCRRPYWKVTWTTAPGDQPLMKINGSNVTGNHPVVEAREKVKGGQFMRNIGGELLRTLERTPQVEVIINGISSKCSGDCGFEWSEDSTPVVTGISPSQGSEGLETLLTVTGTGFIGNASIMIGDAECEVQEATATTQVCSVGRAPAGTYPVWITFPSLGRVRYQGNFTNLLNVTSISPLSGSVAGGTLLTVSGFGFGEDTVVTVGGEECSVVDLRFDELACRTPAASAGSQSVTVWGGDMSQTASSSFNYDESLTPLIATMSPEKTTVIGHRVLTITGSNLGSSANETAVFVGRGPCPMLEWSPGNLTCLLPVLPPGLYRVDVRVGNNGNPRNSPGVNASIEYVLEVHSVSPRVGSLLGGTQLTLWGAGFSSNASLVRVSVGRAECEVMTSSEDKLECRGERSAWSPASLDVALGDTVAWLWEAPLFQPKTYRVFSVSSPGATEPDDEGAFNSGETPTPKGFFRYRFTTPGVFYYSSGPTTSGRGHTLQGVVRVKPPGDQTPPVIVTLGASPPLLPLSPTGPMRTARSVPQCTAAAPDCGPSTNETLLTLSPCATPMVTSVSPLQGTAHQVVRLQGNGFSDTACANEVTVGGLPCEVLNSTQTELFFRVPLDSGAPVGVPHPVAMVVRNLGAALLAVRGELERRLVLLPVVDSVAPPMGSPTGYTRLSVWGSGFSLEGRVTVAGVECEVVSVNYTRVVCDSGPRPQPGSGDVVYQTGRLTAACSSDCSFTYDAAATPAVTGVAPGVVDGNGTTALEVTAATDGAVTLMVGALPAGEHPLRVVVRSKGLATGAASLVSLARASLAPATGSVAGGTPLVFTGNGFAPGNTSVMVGNEPCHIQEMTPGELRCLTPEGRGGGQVTVQINVFDVEYPPLNFTYAQAQTPNVSSVMPSTGASGAALTLVGQGFGGDPQLVGVTINHAPCNVTAVNDTHVWCTAGESPGGTYEVKVHHKVKGRARSDVEFTYELLISAVQPDEGSFGGGAMLVVQGSGFDPSESRVQICGEECEVYRDRSTSTQLYCLSPPNHGNGSEVSCAVTVANEGNAANMSGGFTYRTLLTPVVSGVAPRRGGTAGGTRITISGSGFSTSLSEVNVTVAGSVCDVQSTNATHIVCVTNSQGRSQEAKVRVSIGDRGIARMDNADFFYIDVWSSRFTWGGLTPPEKGTFVVITKGQTILLDESTPVLKMLLIKGGTLVFEEKDLELQAENILITDGGRLQVGQEGAPFQHKAIITLHGHLRSTELPVYGTKTLAVREGVLDLHGIPVPVTWTHLAQTAPSGSSTITLKLGVTWRVGDEIVIASTGHRHSQAENEVRTIASVSADGMTLTLTEALEHTHLGVSVPLPGGKVLEGRAEVGLLTRNVVVRGSQSMDWAEKIEACPEGFNTGEFATQTCFQGRFGEETGSDQFGGCIMFHAPRPNENLAVGRLAHVEVFHAGQAFRLGRYPIHWHLMGDVHNASYVRGCAIHQTFNRAVTIHDTHRLLVEHNVIYDVMGGAFFIEDGVETGNVLQYNLAVFVRQSTSLLNDDVTPAAYWVTNPDNVVRHNAAAGGTHFGFWYRMHEHPDGPSYDRNVCQKRVPLGEFTNNTVHSQGWFGLWIFQDYFPMAGGRCRSSTPQPAVFRGLTVWNCEKGAEWVNAGALQFSGFLMANNEKAGVEAKRIRPWAVRDFGEEGGATLSNSTMVGHVGALNGAGWEYRTRRGVIAPFDDGMSVIGTTFVNFDRNGSAAIGVTTVDGTCVHDCGGWAVRFRRVEFVNTTNRGAFRWEHEVQLVDLDGSLTGQVNQKVVPMSGLLDPALCRPSPEWSGGDYPGALCDPSVDFHRVSLNNPSPSSLQGKDLVLSNHGVPYLKKRLTHKLGWMALLPSGQTYNWYFKDVDQITNITYSAGFYSFKPDQHVIMCHNLTQRPDSFRIVDVRNASATPLSFSENSNGDWHLDSSNNLCYMISGSTPPQRTASVDRSTSDAAVNFQVFRCFYPDCLRPAPPPPATLAPTPARRPQDFILWSNASFWESSAENNFSAPAEGANVVIPSGQWVVLDGDTPPLNKLTVVGVLEIPDTTNDTASSRQARSLPAFRTVVIEATYISIQGGKLIAGWSDEPFRGQLHIKLNGDHRTPDWPLPNGPNQGSKVLGVFGTLELYGLAPNVYHTKLAATAAAGTDTLTLDQSVDWKTGDEVVISTTGFNAWETETRHITAVSADGLTLTLNQSLEFTHIAGTHSVPGTSASYTLSADVGLLTRNIKVIGQDYPQLFEESFGARVLVGAYSWEGIDYKGVAQIRNVEFHHSGQQGWSDFTDPRYSVAFLNLGEVAVNESYLQGCAFHNGFSPAIGVFGTDGMFVDDNVVHHTVGEGIRVWGNAVTVRRNLVTLTRWPGSYQDREEDFNYDWNAAIEVSEGINVVLQHNIVAGFERVGYRIDGEPCPGNAWLQNEAHGGLYGVYMNKDGLPRCSLIRRFTVWKSYDYGIYFQTASNVIVAGVTLADNGLGLMPLVYSPPSLPHLYADKTIRVRDSLVVGTSPGFNCSDGVPMEDFNIRESSSERGAKLPDGGRSGLGWPWFESGHNAAPFMPHHGNSNYNAIRGLMTVVDTIFVAFKSVCPGVSSAMFMTSPSNNDLHHPIQVERITVSDSTEDSKVFIHRPDVGKVNPSDCVDMECDAKKKSMLKDLDGSFLGAVGTVVPQSEYAWNGDPSRGLGDYRIPKVMLTYPNGSRIPVDQIAPNKGVIRENCTYMPAWQSYKCFGLNYRLLAIESMDADTETRRLSPVAILGGGFVDLINGPQDHGWCSGYTCQLRLSLFHAMVATGRAFDVFFSSVSPQKLRLMLLNAPPTESVLVSVFYSKPKRLDVYVNNQLIAPTNAEWNAENTDYTMMEPSYPGQYVPALNSSLGTNFFDRDTKMLQLLVRGSDPVEIRTSPLLVIAFNLPAMTEDQFFGDSLVRNLALFLKVPSSMIRITKVVREDGGGGGARRRKRAAAAGLTVEVEIQKPPVQQTSNTTDDEAAFVELQSIADDLGQAAVSGNLSQSIGFNVSSVGITAPPPPASDPTWNQVAAEEVTREEPTVSFVSSVDSLRLMEEPIAGEYVGPLSQQPSLMALDEEGNCVSVGVTSLRVTATLKDASGVAVDGLEGNTTILFRSCWANFTDLAIGISGTSTSRTHNPRVALRRTGSNR